MYDTKIINIYGNEGSGKSTIASYLFSELKERNIECELVTEVAKDFVWQEDNNSLSNQVLVFGNQLMRLERLIGKVEYIITDAPLLLQIGFYKSKYLPGERAFKKLVLAHYKRFNNIDVALKSRKVVSKTGRIDKKVNAMKYITNHEFDLKSRCENKEEILEFVLTKVNENKDTVYFK